MILTMNNRGHRTIYLDVWAKINTDKNNTNIPCGARTYKKQKNAAVWRTEIDSTVNQGVETV
jgi:hypothetical protein